MHNVRRKPFWNAVAFDGTGKKRRCPTHPYAWRCHHYHGSAAAARRCLKENPPPKGMLNPEVALLDAADLVVLKTAPAQRPTPKRPLRRGMIPT